MYKRTFYYVSKLIQQSLFVVKKYENLPKVVMTNILNFNLLNDTKKEMTILHWDFTLKDKNTYKEKFLMSIYIYIIFCC